MNNLKYIPRISNPCHASPSAVLLSRQPVDMCLKKQTFRFQTVDSISTANRSHVLGVKYSKQFSRNLRLVSKESKPIYKQRSGRSSVTSLKKQPSVNRKVSLQNAVKSACHYSTYQNSKCDSSGITKRRTFQNDSIANNANTINRHSSVVASIGKHHRSYAEMIADYSEILNTKSTGSTRNHNLYFNNGIRKSPFSTVSTPKISKVTKRNRISNKKLGDDSHFSTDAKQSIDFQRHNTSKNTDRECIAARNDDQSYAKLVADCSKYTRTMSPSNVANSGLILKSDVLTRNSRKSFATPTRNASSTNMQETSSVVSKTRPAITGEETDDYWKREIQSVMNDLNTIKRKVANKIEKSHKTRDTTELDFAKLQDRIDKLTEIIEAREQKEKNIKEANLQNRSDVLNKAAAGLPATGTSATSSSAAKNFARMPSGGNTGVSKQPQVKLRMVPSAKESVVSIDVDSATGLSDPLDPAASKQLSVVVQSDQRGDAQSTENQRNAPTTRQQSAKSTSRRDDFGPMRISISEDSAPIKQIEFSINGKPVSELKSITARTEKLDVVSSMDKIEIRIPFAKDDDANAPSNIRESVLAKESNDLSSEQILNVQISANFQNEFTKSRQTEEINTTTPPPPVKTNYVFDTLADKTTTDSSSIKKNKHLVGEKMKMKTMKKNTIRSPEINKDDTIESSDDSRFPSKMIPWWASSDSFKKMKKLDEDLSIKKKKTSLNPENPITKSEKSEETPNSKSSTSNIQSMNNITITDNSSNPISYSRSTEHLVESEPASHYFSSFGVKSDQENSTIISNSRKHVLQTGDNLVAEDNKKTPEIKQIESIALHPDTNRRASIKERKSILRRKYEMPSSAENCLLGRNREKKRQHSLEQTLSIEDVSNTRTEIKNAQNMRSAEKKQDNTWVDYGLQSWTKSTERLNNEKLMSTRSAEKEVRKTSQMEQDVTNTTTDVKTQNSTIINNILHTRKDDATAINSSNLKNFPNVTQTTKQEKLTTNITVPRDKFKQTLETLSESSKINSSTTIETSSKAIQDSIKSHNAFTNELPSSQTSSNSILNNERTVTKNSNFAEKLNKTTDMGDTTVNASQNSTSRDLLSKSEKHYLRTSKSEKDRENISGSASSPRKPTSADLLSARSKMQIESMVTPKDNRIYTRRLAFMESFGSLYPNFDRKDNISQPVTSDFENVGNISDHNAPNAVARTCTDTDRPEKNMLYSAWMQFEE